MIGVRLEEIIFRETGEEPCSDCQSDMRSLDQMTREQVLASKEAIAITIRERAEAKAVSWMNRMAARYAPSLVERVLVEWIEEACNV